VVPYVIQGNPEQFSKVHGREWLPDWLAIEAGIELFGRR
jgi:hypothetical protein